MRRAKLNRASFSRPRSSSRLVHNQSACAQGESTYRSNYSAWPVHSRPKQSATKPIMAPVDMQSFLNDTFTTTNQVHHPPHAVVARHGRTSAQARPHLPWLAGETTHEEAYPWKASPLLQLADSAALNSSAPVITPFDGESEYAAAFVPHALRPFIPHLTGIVDKQGISLPGPRRSLQVCRTCTSMLAAQQTAVW